MFCSEKLFYLKDVIIPSGGYSLDETLASFHGRNGVHTKINKKPAGEGHCYNNVSRSKDRFCESLLLQRTATEGNMKKDELVEKMIGSKLRNKGLFLTSDRG